jgi:hypothetical protein
MPWVKGKTLAMQSLCRFVPPAGDMARIVEG